MDGVGDRLRQARTRVGMTQAELWRTAGVSVPALSRLEQGHTTPKLSTVRKLARALGVRVEWLTVGEAPMVAKQGDDQ